MNISQLLVRSAQVFPQQPAVLLSEHVLCDYRGLAQRAAAIGQALRVRLNCQPGDRVALLLRNSPHYLEVMYGAWFAGLIVVPINYKLHAREVAYILADSGSSVLFADADLAQDLSLGVQPLPGLRAVIDVESRDYTDLLKAEALPPAPAAPTDTAWLFYTSGTTGRPKGVMLTHRNLMAMSLCYFADVDQIAPTDACLYAAPMSHGAGLYNLPHVLAGARHVIPESRGFDADEILALSKRLRQVSMFAAPTMVKRLVRQAEGHATPGDGIKTVVYGGGPMYVADIQQALRVMGPRFVQIYGQGECPMAITALSRAHLIDHAHPRHAERLASVGVAQSQVEIRIVDPQGRVMPAGEDGEIVVRGEPVMPGYWGNPQASAATLRDGWLYTGDVGQLDEDGFLSLKDRTKDMIISGGSNIYPREVEELLLMHPGVREVAVIGRSHAEWGEEVVAFVALEAGCELDTHGLDALCLENIARFKRPRHYQVVDELPKNNYGKVLKTALRTFEWPQPAAQAPH